MRFVVVLNMTKDNDNGTRLVNNCAYISTINKLDIILVILIN